jgi:hypothetical protein
MTASEILQIAITVGIVQMLCDLVAYWRVFSKEPYQRALEKLQRCKFKLDQITQKGQISQEDNNAAKTETAGTKKKNKLERNAKQLERAKDDHKDALANVAQRHTVPNMATSMVFLIIMRVMGTELKGKVIALLPFTPFGLLRKITARNLEFSSDFVFESTDDKITDIMQACGFAFVYMLTTASIKYYVHELFGVKPPPGADSILSVVDSPQGQKFIRAMGVEPPDFKAD